MDEDFGHFARVLSICGLKISFHQPTDVNWLLKIYHNSPENLCETLFNKGKNGSKNFSKSLKSSREPDLCKVIS